MPFSKKFQKILDDIAPATEGTSETSRHLAALKLCVTSIVLSDGSIDDTSSTVASTDTPHSLSTVSCALGNEALSSLSSDISFIFDCSSQDGNFFREMRLALFQLVLNASPEKEAVSLEAVLLCIKTLFKLSIPH